MKRFLQFVFILGILFSLTSCGNLFGWQTSDEDAISRMEFEPLEWKDEYVITVTEAPFGIQIWDSDKENNIYVYNLDYFTVIDIEIMNKSIWAILFGNEYSLVRIDVATGKIHYIENARGATKLQKEIYPSGTEILWEQFYGISEGIKFQKFDVTGNKLDSFFMKENGVNMARGAIYVLDGATYFFTAKDEAFKNINEQKGILVMNLDDKIIYTLSIKDFFPSEFISENLNKIPDDFYINFYSSDTKYGEYILARFSHSSNIAQEEFYLQVFFKIDLKISESNVVINSFCTNENYTMDGLFVDLFAKTLDGDYLVCRNGSTGKLKFFKNNTLIKSFPIEKQTGFCSNYQNKLFFSRNTWTFDYSANKWDKSGQPSIYVYNMQTKKMHIVYADGTREEVQPEEK